MLCEPGKEETLLHFTLYTYPHLLPSTTLAIIFLTSKGFLGSTGMTPASCDERSESQKGLYPDVRLSEVVGVANCKEVVSFVVSFV